MLWGTVAVLLEVVLNALIVGCCVLSDTEKDEVTFYPVRKYESNFCNKNRQMSSKGPNVAHLCGFVCMNGT